MNNETKLLTTTLILLFAVSLTISNPLTKAQDNTTVIVDPSSQDSWKLLADYSVMYWTIDIRINNVTDLEAWAIGIYWNKADVNCDSYVIHDPASWNETITAGEGIDNNYNSTHGFFSFADASVCCDTFNGSMSVATLTFHQIASGTTNGINTYFTFNDTYTEVHDEFNNPIEFSSNGGSDKMHSGLAPWS